MSDISKSKNKCQAKSQIYLVLSIRKHMEKGDTYWQVEGEIRAPRGSTNCLLVNEKITSSWSIDYDLVRISYKKGAISKIIFESFVECNHPLKAEYLAGEKFEQIVEGFNLSGVLCHVQMKWPKKVSEGHVDESILIKDIDEKQDSPFISRDVNELELVKGERQEVIPCISWKDSVRWIELVKKAEERDKKRLMYLIRALRLVPIDKAAAYLYAIEIIENFFDHEFENMKEKVKKSKKSIEYSLSELKSVLPEETIILNNQKNKIPSALEYSWKDALKDLCTKTGFYKNTIQTKETFVGRLRQMNTTQVFKGDRLVSIPAMNGNELNKKAEKLFEENKEFWEGTSTILWRKRHDVAHFRSIIDQVTIEHLVCLELSKFLIEKSINGNLS